MDSKECMVSVLCTAFNHEAYIRSALEGFVSQRTNFAFEVLINDDHSTDGTATVIKEYEEKYPHLIRAFYQPENLYSRNIDIYSQVLYPNARGKYLALCEGDDYWTDPDKLQLQVNFLEAHPEYSACVHNSMKHLCNFSLPDEPLVASRGDHDVLFADLIQGMSHAYHTSSLMAKREILTDRMDFFYIARAHGFGDFPDALRLLLSGPIRFLDRSMSVYRICSGGASWSANTEESYSKLKEFVAGEKDMLLALRPHVTSEQARLVDEVILQREFELLYIEGRVREMLKPPYFRIFRAKPLSFRVKNMIKLLFPRLHSLYRRRRGYGDT